MAEAKKTLRADYAVIIGASCLVGGFLLGLLTYHLISPTPVQTAARPAAGMPPAGAVAPPDSALPNFSEQIRELKKVVEADPKNRGAWVTMGNYYFDSAQYVEAVDAYSKALALQGDDPNVLTDRGIMYKELGDFPSAVKDFAKAADLSPTHTQSLYNLGLTKLHDQQDYKGAKEAWERLLKRNPPPEMASQVQSLVANLDAMIQRGDTPGTK